jgi:hypothetical protein
VYRVARRSGNAFDPPSWNYVQPETGTFGNRFDDPGQALGVPPEGRFRVISSATTRVGAYGEVLANLRPALGMISRIAEKTRDIDQRTLHAMVGVIDPEDTSARLLSADWRTRRQVGHAVVDPGLWFADVAAASSLAHLRGVPELARLAHELGLADIDISAISSQQRPFTQACSRYIHEVHDEDRPRFAGIRYMSRLGSGAAWECWALFDDRVQFVDPPTARPIRADDAALLEVARLYRQTIEADDGRLLRPWQG